MLTQPQHNCVVSEACMLDLCAFEGHILITVLRLRITPPVILQVVLQSRASRRKKGGECHHLAICYGCKADLVKAVKLSYVMPYFF